MEEEFSCSICLEVAENAVETSCCHQIFCEQCLKRMIGKECPQCRSGFQMIISHVSRRVIGNMEVKCSHPRCNKSLTRSTIKDHENNCEHRLFRCPAPSCDFRGEKSTYGSHLLSIHGDQIIKNAQNIFCAPNNVSSCPNDVRTVQIRDRIVKTRNSDGRDSRLGRNGKFYCAGPLGEFACNCCDGFCGPDAGCNCKPCMMLDVQLRRLPQYWLVNSDGASCRVSSETGLFYCGRKVLIKSPECDGWCGPTNGPNCCLCQRVQRQCSTRYAGI